MRDWTACFFCQSDNGEPLNNPLRSVKLRGSEEDLEACFRKVLKNIASLHALDRLPADMELTDVLPCKSPLISGGGDVASDNSTEYSDSGEEWRSDNFDAWIKNVHHLNLKKYFSNVYRIPCFNLTW